MSWCGDCLVFVYGADNPPLCVGCALLMSGVRTHGLPAMTRKQLRAQKRAERATARDARRQEPAPQPAVAHEPPRPTVDWSTPWWEAAAPAD